MFAARFFAGVSLCVGVLATVGCGGNGSACGVTGLNVGPSTATADHAAAAPGNSQTFNAALQFSTNPGCPLPIDPVRANSNWTASDPSVHLSSSPAFQVTATCTAAVTNPVTITAIATSANGQMLTGQATLTCI
jgi:hypothetical protein